MKKLLSLALIAVLGFGSFALAQTINKSLQLSQDASGPVNIDTLFSVYFPRHLLFPRTNSPVLTSCGTAPSIIGNDTTGKITTGSAATTCTITFETAFAIAPACLVQAQGGATQPTYTTSTTAITMTVDIASTVYNYFCPSQG